MSPLAPVPHPGPLAASPAGPPGQLTASATRRIDAPLTTARGVVVTAIRQLRFTFAVDQLSRVVARRGSTIAGFTLSPARVPLEIRVDLAAGPRTEDGEATVASFLLQDRWGLAGTRQWGAVAAYRAAFAEITEALDRALAGLSPDIASSPWDLDLGPGDVAPLAGASAHAAQAGRVLARGTDVLFGAAKGPRTASDGTGLETARVVCDDRHLDLPAERLDGLLTAGQLIAANPAPLPVHLAQEVQQLVVSLEDQLESLRSRPRGSLATLAIAEKQLPVLTFCYQQSLIREELPLRLLLVCTTCKLPKVANPDLAALREKNRRRGVLATSVGGVLTMQGIAPYIMLGRLVQARSSDPDFVCGRCQGLDADQRVITFCPTCGDRRDESVLRACGNCGHDFRRGAAEVPPWRAGEPPAAPAASAAPALPSPAPPAAWRPDPTGRHEHRYWDGSTWTEHVSDGGLA